MATTLFHIALFHLKNKNLPAAEAAAQESLEKYHIMANMSHAAFDIDAEELLERIRKAKEADA